MGRGFDNGDGGEGRSGDDTHSANVPFDGYDTSRPIHGDAQSKALEQSGILPPADDYLLLLQQAQAVLDKSEAAGAATDSAQPDSTGENSSNRSSTAANIHDKKDLIAGNPIQDAQNSLEKWWHPQRENPDKDLDYKASVESYRAAHLDKFRIDPRIIAGTLRNESFHLKQLDYGENNYVRKFGDTLPGFDFSMGDAQMKKNSLLGLINAHEEKGEPLYPQLAHMKTDPMRASLNHRDAALLIGAYYAETARRLEAGIDPIPNYHGAHARQVRQTIEELWSSDDPQKRTDALIRSYNPGDGQTHVNNVREHMQALQSVLAPIINTPKKPHSHNP